MAPAIFIGRWVTKPTVLTSRVRRVSTMGKAAEHTTLAHVVEAKTVDRYICVSIDYPFVWYDSVEHSCVRKVGEGLGVLLTI